MFPALLLSLPWVPLNLILLSFVLLGCGGGGASNDTGSENGVSENKIFSAGIWSGSIGNKTAVLVIDETGSVFGSSEVRTESPKKYHSYTGNIDEMSLRVQRRDNDYYFDSNSPNYFANNPQSVPVNLTSIFQQEITGEIDSENALLSYNLIGSETDIAGSWRVYYHRIGREQITDRYIIDISISEQGIISGSYTVENQHNPPFFEPRITNLTGSVMPTQFGNNTALDFKLVFNFDNSIRRYNGYAIKSSTQSVQFTNRSMLVMLQEDEDNNSLMTFKLNSQIAN